MPLQGIASSGFAAATCFGMLVGETHAGAVVVELGRACGKQGRSGQRHRRFWQSLGNHQQWIYNMLRDESAVVASYNCLMPTVFRVVLVTHAASTRPPNGLRDAAT